MLTSLNAYLDKRKEYGVIFLRIIVGWRLIDGTIDNILSWERMIEFEAFLTAYHFPMPLVSAVVSVYAQFLCGLLFIVGAFTRGAAFVMIINFTIALLAVHVGLSFEESFDALMMLFASLFFLFHGPGKFSIDESPVFRKKI